jgi:hypothetical protein
MISTSTAAQAGLSPQHRRVPSEEQRRALAFFLCRLHRLGRRADDVPQLSEPTTCLREPAVADPRFIGPIDRHIVNNSHTFEEIFQKYFYK